MGPSGAGKTSLLNVLSGNVNSAHTTGDVLINEGPVPSGFKRISAVVPQDDVLLSSLTPRETLMFAARLRLDVLPEERVERVNSVMKSLSLLEHADTLTGDVNKRGLSGGQRKRVSIALELLINPSILFLDEPTSGLDSKMAEDVVYLIHDLAQEQNRTIICTIHQPSYRIFSRFDSLVLLKEGRVVYANDVTQTNKYFSDAPINRPPPAYENPVDFYMRILQEDCDEEDKRDDVEKSAKPAFDYAGVWSNSTLNARNLVATDGFWAPGVLEKLNQKSYAVSRIRQFVVLFHRFCVDYMKDKSKFIGGGLLKATVGIIIGVVWLNQARPDDNGLYTQDSIFPTQGALFVCLFSSVMDTLFPTVMVMPTTKALLLREYKNGVYSLPPYFLAQLCSNVFFQTINSVFMGLPIYLLVGLNLEPTRLLVFLSSLAVMSSIGAALGLFIGSLVSNTQQAQQVVMPTLVPLELFSGYIIPYNKIPSYFLWLYNISFFAYALSLLEINQFKGMKFSDCTPEVFGCYNTGEELLTAMHINVDDVNTDLTALAITFLLLSWCGYYGMRWLVGGWDGGFLGGFMGGLVKVERR
jgi:ABC-type multidrug transport system ATPase subunit